jgi:hypothetical protein
MMSKQNDADDDYMGCPHCGAALSDGADFCRACGSSDADGWGDAVDLGDDEFDYDDYIAAEFSGSGVNRQTPMFWRWVAIGLLILYGFFYLFVLR